jgi:hypothetical protein
MLKKIASMLDDVANTLEAHGLIKEAFEIDKVSVKIDSLSVQPPAGVAPPQDIDRLFPNIHINWKFSKDDNFVLVLSKGSFNKEFIQGIINHNNFEKISYVPEGIVFFFKNTYKAKI